MPRPAARRALLLVSTALVALVALLVPTSAPALPSGGVQPAFAASAAAASDLAAARRKPNVVVVMTDDMAATDLRYMPRTRRLVGRAGSRFTQALTSNPMCCPARAAFLTGQESHNSGVLSNGGPRGGYQALRPGPRLPSWLRSAGYLTAFMGKHLNGYRPDRRDAVERGWSVHDPVLKGLYNYRSYSTWNNGRPRRVRQYVTTYLMERANKTVRRFDRRDRRPFFLWVANIAPHTARINSCSCFGDPVPAARDRGSMKGTRSPSRRSAAFNHRNGADKPPFMRGLERVGRRAVDRTFQRRVESLKSVDRQVASLVRTLRRAGELKRTVIMFTSDNGYLLGQHRYVGKRLPYEDSVRVPLLVRGPRMARGLVTSRPASTVDLTATIVDLAGATPTHQLDGVSLVPGLRAPAAPWGRHAVVTQTGAAAAEEGDSEAPGEEVDLKGWLHRGYRDSRYSYSHWPARKGWSAHAELYDRKRDPGQLHNVVDDPAYADTVTMARQRAAQLAACAGADCHPAWGPLPGPS